MNKVITRHHVKASELPAELRGEIPDTAMVTVTIAEEAPSSESEDPIALLKRFHAEKRDSGRTMEDIVAEIRQMRDEWDD